MYINNQSIFQTTQPTYRVQSVNRIINNKNNQNSQQQQNTRTQALEDKANISDMAKLLFEAESNNDEAGLITLLKEFVGNAQGNGYNANTTNNLQNTSSQKSENNASDNRISSVNQVLLSKLRAYKQQDYALSSLKVS